MSGERTSRLPIPLREDLSPAQAEVYDRIASGPRGKVEGPLAIWLHSPELANRAQALGEFARYRTSFEPRLSELAILVTARHWTSHFEWHVHAPIAAKNGLTAAVIEAIRGDRRPRFAAADEEAVYAYVHEVLTTGKTSDGTLKRIVSFFGTTAAVELSALVGYYSMCAFTLALAEPPLPEGGPGPLPPR